jgi:hypothetical protein
MTVAIIGAGAMLGSVLAHRLHQPEIMGEVGFALAMAKLAQWGVPLSWLSGTQALAKRLWVFSERACGISG